MSAKDDEYWAGLQTAMVEAVIHGVPEDQLTIQHVPLDLIMAGDNDRKDFKHVSKLAESIFVGGLNQPVTLRQVSDDLYQIVAGESRTRAYKLLHDRNPADPRWMAIPAIVREMDESQVAATMLSENTARKDLNPVEEAKGYQKRMVCLGWAVETCATVAGVGVQRVKNRLELLKLRDDVLELIQNNQMDPQYGVIMATVGLSGDFQGVALRAYNNNPAPNLAWWRTTCGQLLEQQAQSNLFGLFAMTEQVAQIVESANTEPVKVEDYKPTRVPKNPLNLLIVMIRDCRALAGEWDKRGSYKERNKYMAAADKLEQALHLLEQAQAPQVKVKVA